MKVQYVSANIHIYKHIAFLGVYNSAAKKLSKFLRFRNVLLAACNLGARKKKHGNACKHIFLSLYGVFSTELEKWRSPEFYEREVHRMQLPFSGKVPGGCVSVEERHERRAQQLRRLQEINARRREEKLLQDQERLDRLMAVQARHIFFHL